MTSRWLETSVRRLLAAALLLMAGSSFVHAGEYQDDLKARRARLRQSLDAGTVLIA